MPALACPHCGYQPLPKAAHYCPQCSQPVDVAARVTIDSQVGTNYGKVIGVETQVLNGDVYGGDIYQVQVYVLSEVGRSAIAGRTLDRNIPPYPYLQPFTARDRLRFCGRQGETRQALSCLGASRLLVLYGPAGVGKTSLLAAGLIPQLAEDGALAVHVRDYIQPLNETLWKALSAGKDQLSLPLRRGATLPELLKSIQQAAKGTLVLILDQFESLFRPDYSSELRAAQINALVESLKAVPADYLRLVLGVRDDQLMRLSDLQEALPDLFRSFMELKSLSRAQARQAILEPNEHVTQPLFFSPGMLDELLLPELDALTRETPNSIYPPHLQIVCRWLYDKVQGRGLRMVSPELYLHEGRGAEGILVNHLDETLRTHLVDRRQLAEQALDALAGVTSGDWVAAANLGLAETATNELIETLDQLVEAGLLLRRDLDGNPQYAYASEVLLEAVEGRHGEQISRLSQARRELQRLWAGWKASSDLPSKRQVQRLQAEMPRLAPGALHSLLLLRAAIDARKPAAPWVTALRMEQGRALVAALEGIQMGDDAIVFTPTDLLEAWRILNTDPPNDSQTDTPSSASKQNVPDFSTPYGLLAETAVTGGQSGARQAAALALLSFDPYNAADRLSWALGLLSGYHRLWRKIEIFGSILEAEPEAAGPLASRMSSFEWLTTWFWRLGQRVASRRLESQVLGAALGAGVGLAALRFMTASLMNITVMLYTLLNFLFGGLLGVGLFFGLEISRLLPKSSPFKSPRLNIDQGLLSTTAGRRPNPLFTASMGFLFAWIAYLFIAFTAGNLSLSGKGLVIGLGALWVMGLSLVLALPEWRDAGTTRLGLRVLLAAIWSALLAGLAAPLGQLRQTVVIFTPAALLNANLSRFIQEPWLSWLVKLMPGNWFILISILDAALVGSLLVIGLLAGLRWAMRSMENNH